MGQSLAEKDTSWLARFVEDMIRTNTPSALTNISAEEVTVNDSLIIGDQLQASQQAIDYMRPPPQILLSNTAQGALPHTNNVTVSRFVKNGVLVVTASGYTGSAGACAIGVVWDGGSLGTINFTHNVVGEHHIMGTVAFSLTEVAVGAHTLQLTNAGNTVMDANDRCTAILHGG